MVHSLFKVEPVATVYSGMAEVSERLPRVTMIKGSILHSSTGGRPQHMGMPQGADAHPAADR